jgi:protein-tyrosine-phosphatase
MGKLPPFIPLKKRHFLHPHSTMASGKSVLFVCMANTSRSPMCEAVCRSIAPGLRVASAGIGAYPGSPAGKYSRPICQEHGLDLSQHKSQQFVSQFWDEFDLICAIDSYIFSELSEDKPTNSRAALALFLPPDGISDPCGGNMGDYRRTFDQISGEMANFLRVNGLLNNP